MAKRSTTPIRMLDGAGVAALAEQALPETPVIKVPAGGTLTVIVDVGEMTIPYTVSYAGRTEIKAVVDRAETLMLKPGHQILGWAFAHAVKGWSHTIAVSVNGGPPKILESRSEAKKDQDHSVGFAIVEA
jgi:hypothetical protein